MSGTTPPSGSAPPSVLGSASNYLITSNCNPLTSVSVTINVDADIVANNGFSFQLNANSPLGALSAFQQYVIYLDPTNNQLSISINCYTQSSFGMNPQPSLILISSPFYLVGGGTYPVVFQGGRLPANLQLKITLNNDSAGRINGAEFNVLDTSGGFPIANMYVNLYAMKLVSGGPITLDDLAQIITYQLNLVGPYGGLSTSLLSGAGTITYSAAELMTVAESVPLPCSNSGVATTAEQANSVYGVLPTSPSNTITQSFTFSASAAPMIRRPRMVSLPRP